MRDYRPLQKRINVGVIIPTAADMAGAPETCIGTHAFAGLIQGHA
jgi:hypothetical protein